MPPVRGRCFLHTWGTTVVSGALAHTSERRTLGTAFRSAPDASSPWSGAALGQKNGGKPVTIAVGTRGNAGETRLKVEYVRCGANGIILSGFMLIEGVNLQDNTVCQKSLVLVDRNTGEEIRAPLANELRTDITYRYGRPHCNYDWAGFAPHTVRFCDLVRPYPVSWDLYVELAVAGQQPRRVRLRFELAALRSRLKTRYFRSASLVEINPCYGPLGEVTIQVRTIGWCGLVRSKTRKLLRTVRTDLLLLRGGQLRALFILYLYRIISPYLRGRQIWLVGERRDTAQDNSYHLFRFLTTEVRMPNCYYVIEKGAADVSKVRSLGAVVYFGSVAHTLLLLSARFCINSYVHSANMYTKEYKEIVKFYPEYDMSRRVFLQHGVIGMSRVNHSLHRNRAGFDLFVVSSSFEQDHIVTEFGYDRARVPITGLPRFDTLAPVSSSNLILVMPTWRTWLKSKSDVESSEYLEKWIGLLRDGRFLNLLEQHDLKVAVYFHYQVQRFLDRPELAHGRISCLSKKDAGVQDLLNEAALLITDYSSVSFDAAYRGIPVVFFQFDRGRFFSEHYNEGPIGQSELFGPVETDAGGVVEVVRRYVESGFRMLEEDESKARRFFAFRDRNNCVRVYEAICRMDDNTQSDEV